MAVTTAIHGKTVFGDKRVHFGISTLSGGATTEDIVTGLQQVYAMTLTGTGAAVVADAPTVDETLPLASGDVTIIATANTAMYWMAIGY